MEIEQKKSYLLLAAIIVVVVGILLIVLGIASSFKPISNNIPQPVIIPSVTSKPQASLVPEGETTIVTRVVDGDTIEIEGGSKVRYIGIDTPETVDPRRPVGCFGKEASLENSRLVSGKRVILVKDVSETDQFGRLLRYVYLIENSGNLIFLNDELVRNGYAKASTYPPDVKFSEQFLAAEKEAREENRGLWQKCLL